jgi:hypothetical protein
MRITTTHFETAQFDALDATYILSNEKPEVGPSKIVHLVSAEKDAYMQIFKDAQRRKYKNILVLRDHVAFRSTNSATDLRAVDDFLSANVDRPFAYLLGCLPVLMVPVGKGTFKTLAVDYYACVFSPSMREHLLQKGDYLLFHTLFRTYTYTKPLCHLTGNEPALLLTVDEKGWLYVLAKLMMYLAVVVMVLVVWLLFNYKSVLAYLRSSLV